MEKAAEGDEEPSETDPSWSDYVGKYQDNERRWVVMTAKSGLVIVNPKNPTPDGALVLKPTDAPHTFVLTGRSGFQPIEETVTFDVDEKGKVIAMNFPADRYERVEHW